MGVPYFWGALTYGLPPIFGGLSPFSPLLGCLIFAPPVPPISLMFKIPHFPAPFLGCPHFPNIGGGFVSHPSKVGQLSLALLLLSLGAPIRAEGGPPFLGGGVGGPLPPQSPPILVPPPRLRRGFDQPHQTRQPDGPARPAAGCPHGGWRGWGVPKGFFGGALRVLGGPGGIWGDPGKVSRGYRGFGGGSRLGGRFWWGTGIDEQGLEDFGVSWRVWGAKGFFRGSQGAFGGSPMDLGGSQKIWGVLGTGLGEVEVFSGGWDG